VTTNVHPSSGELLTALNEPDQAAATIAHLDECLACRVRLSRIRHASGLVSASIDSLQRIVDASTPLPNTLADVVSGSNDEEPQPNEIWRVGRSEALLVWVRRVFDDGAADVIPLVLDVELADQESVLVAADATPLATETAAMVALRTHVHTGAFLNRVGTLDIAGDVTEVMTAVREGRRPSRVRVGPPIDDDDDQRLEYRQALRDLLAELSPSAWLETESGRGLEQKAIESTANHPPDGFEVIKSDIHQRLPDAQCRDLEPYSVTVDATIRATTVLKVVYLDTAVLVATLRGENLTKFPETSVTAAACRQMTLIETDADAVALVIPGDDWPALLFTTAHMRRAFEVRGGASTGPTATLEGHGLVDTLCKHLEGAMTTWEPAERTTIRIGGTDLHQVATRHANTSIEHITVEGKRARQPAKQTAWASLPNELPERVARFVVAIVSKVPVDEALADLGLETPDD
jgi:hypothetical protein